MLLRPVMVIAIVAIAARDARADAELARARALEAQLDYEPALAIVDGMLARGGADPARYVELQLFAGKLAGGLDRARIAQAHFARALAIRPDTTLPDGTSPKLTEPFAAAKATTRPLAVTVTATRGLVTISAADPLGLVTGIAVHVIQRGAHADLVERGALRIVIRDGATAIEVAALDAAGNRLWVGAPPAEPKPAPRKVARPPIYAQWPTWALLGTGSLVFAGFSAWRFDAAQDDWNRLRARPDAEFAELEAIEQRGRRYGFAANVGLVTAAAAGIATTICLLRGNRIDPDADVHAVPIHAVVTPAGAGIAVSGRF